MTVMSHTVKYSGIIQHSPPVPLGNRALCPDDFSFFGFDGLSREIKRRIRQVEIRGGTPGVSIVEDVVYVPEELTKRRDAQRRGIVGSLLESPAVAYDREVDDEVVYLGSLFNHFGHFLMQSLARAWFLTEVNPSVRVIFDAPRSTWRQSENWMPRIWRPLASSLNASWS